MKEELKLKLLETLGFDVKDYDGHLDEYITENTDINGDDWLWYLDCDNVEGAIREKDGKIIIAENEESDKVAKMFYID